jgi:glycosyltransferase involved in cell wall biosynthesis
MTVKILDKTKVVGLSWGNPRSVSTYCGMPYFLFRGLRKRSYLVKAMNSMQFRPRDLWNSAFELHLSLRNLAIQRNAFWRYQPENIARLSKRFESRSRSLPEHNVLVEFDGVVLPPEGKKLIAYIEMSVETAATERAYALTHGYANYSDLQLRQAKDGERLFLSKCDLVWTNSDWTAKGLMDQGVPRDKIRIYAPPGGVQYPGLISRDWSKCHLLFIGIEWHRKGGDILLDAFKLLRKENPNARLTIIGCKPVIKEPGVRVLGFLRKNRLEEAKLFRHALQEATIYCMPTRWDSTGIPFMEAGLYGLPIIMTRGQGREQIFSDEMAIFMDSFEASELAEILIQLSKDPVRMQQIGEAGRCYVLKNYTWNVGVKKVIDYIKEVQHPHS